MITIVDYGLGNVLAFANLYKRLNIAVTIAKTRSDLAGASKLILPGVGDFDHAMQLLQNSGMRETLDEMVVEHEMPVMGICVGMQILAHSSTEGELPGLSWINGHVLKFKPTGNPRQMRLPHMGWNDVTPRGNSKLFTGLEENPRFYFLHSYYFDCTSDDDVVAESEYGQTFTCAVQSGNVIGVQFHPEKSHHYGSKLLKNFAEL